jgi:hypothetical protein
MENKLKFRIQSLLSKKDGHISGPMSPTLFAREMAKSVGFKYNRLARVWCEDERINQHYEDRGLTGHDNLIIGMIYKNDVWLSLWVDTGVGGIPIAMAFKSEPEIDFAPVYKKERFAKNLTEAEVKEIFDSIFSDSDQLNIKEE